MPLTLEEAYGDQTQKGAEEVGFFESALDGVATGLWNIPKKMLSLGAEVFDLVGDTNTARDIEEWFDDVNPWDDEAEARTVGKITSAITAIAPLAVTGWGLGVKGADAIRKMAQGAIAAKKTGKLMSLAKMGEKIMGAEKLSKKG